MDDDAPASDATARLAARIAARVAAAHPGRPLDALLADDLAGNELTSLLLHGLRQRALRRSFADVRDHAERMRMSHPSPADARRLHAFDGVAFAAADRFEVLDLAPVQPLGAAARGGVDPNNVLLAARFAEVAADPTTGLVLEMVRRRRRAAAAASASAASSAAAAAAQEPLRLCASQRVLRLQPIDPVTQPDFFPHFRLFALATAVRAPRPADDDACERRALLEHLQVWAALCRALPAAGFAVAGLRIVLSDTRVVRAALAARGLDPDALARQVTAHRPGGTEALLADLGVDLPRATPTPVEVAAERALPPPILGLLRSIETELLAPVRRLAPDVPIAFDFARLQGLTYYSGPFLQLHVRRPDGLELPLGDGGALPWLEPLLSDRRQRLITSGLGAELLVKLYDTPRSAPRATAAPASATPRR